MVKMTGGQALMKSLYQEGVRVIFGLPGVQLYHALDALYEQPEIRLITTRHEQATTYMADGYSRAGPAQRRRRYQHRIFRFLADFGGGRTDRAGPDWIGPGHTA